MDVAQQLTDNGGDVGNINWQRSIGAAAGGAMTGAALAVVGPVTGFTGALATRIGGGVAANAVAGAATSAVASAAGQATSNVTTGLLEGKKLNEIDVLDNVPESALVGGLIGGAFQAGASVLQTQVNRSIRQHIRNIRTTEHNWLRKFARRHPKIQSRGLFNNPPVTHLNYENVASLPKKLQIAQVMLQASQLPLPFSNVIVWPQMNGTSKPQYRPE